MRRGGQVASPRGVDDKKVGFRETVQYDFVRDRQTLSALSEARSPLQRSGADMGDVILRDVVSSATVDAVDGYGRVRSYYVGDEGEGAEAAAAASALDRRLPAPKAHGFVAC